MAFAGVNTKSIGAVVSTTYSVGKRSSMTTPRMVPPVSFSTRMVTIPLLPTSVPPSTPVMEWVIELADKAPLPSELKVAVAVSTVPPAKISALARPPKVPSTSQPHSTFTVLLVTPQLVFILPT